MMDMHKTTIGSVIKALAVLSEVARHPSGALPSEIAEALGIPVPTTYHLLNTLAQEAALTRSADRRYRLGPRIGALSAAYFEQSEPDESLLAPLRWLAGETGETGYLSAWRGADIEVLESVEGSHPVRVAGLERGTHGHAHARASGKLLLAYASATLRDAYFSRHELTALTAHTIVDRARLDAELKRIREAGISFDREEFVLGIACVSAPVIFGGQVLAGFTVSAPVERFRKTRGALVSAVRSAAADAEHAMGGVDPQRGSR